MAKESFMLVSLKEDKAKKLAQVMANPTCTKILDYLAGKDATESQVAKDLNIPLSTVHYNLQQLVDAKLVVAEEFHYSEKGREVNHYKLANKYIIIAPQEDDSFLQHLRKYLPVVAVVAVGAVAIKMMQLFTGTAASQAADNAMMAKSAPEVAPAAADAIAGGEPALRTMAAEAVPEAAMIAPEQAVQTPWWQSPSVDYFIAGAVFVLLVLVIIELVNHLRNKR